MNGPRPCSLAFDGDGVRLFELGLLDLLRNSDLQRAVVELGFDVGFFDVFADIERTAATSGEALLAHVRALVLVGFGFSVRGDGQHAFLQFGCDVLFVEAGQVDDDVDACRCDPQAP